VGIRRRHRQVAIRRPVVIHRLVKAAIRRLPKVVIRHRPKVVIRHRPLRTRPRAGIRLQGVTRLVVDIGHLDRN
jgi:hypothetical protein